MTKYKYLELKDLHNYRAILFDVAGTLLTQRPKDYEVLHGRFSKVGFRYQG